MIHLEVEAARCLLLGIISWKKMGSLEFCLGIFLQNFIGSRRKFKKNFSPFDHFVSYVLGAIANPSIG